MMQTGPTFLRAQRADLPLASFLLGAAEGGVNCPQAVLHVIWWTPLEGWSMYSGQGLPMCWCISPRPDTACFPATKKGLRDIVIF